MIEKYQCPGCGAALEFAPGQEELVCEYCSTRVKISELTEQQKLKTQYERQVENQTIGQEGQRGELSSYHCTSCGADLILDEHTTATKCSYCGSPAIITNRLQDVLKPAKVIPFQINRNQAKEQFKNWLCKGLFTPSIFKNVATLEEIKGIYVPFWLYDYDAQAYLEAACTKVRHERHGDTEYIHTDHYHVVRDVSGSFLKVPVDASEKMPDDVMDMLEPYDYTQLKEFEMPYLSGYESEKYNFESDDRSMTGRVEERVNDYISETARNSIQGYASVHVNVNKVNMQRKKAVYTLLPVWMMTYRYQDENKIFVINGQTGKQVGTLPISKKKMFAWFGGITAGITLFLTMIGYLFG